MILSLNETPRVFLGFQAAWLTNSDPHVPLKVLIMSQCVGEEDDGEEIDDEVEGIEDEEDEEKIPEVHTAELRQDGVFVAGGEPLAELGYGFSEDGGLVLPDVSALHLQRRGVLRIYDGQEEVSFDQILHRGLGSDDLFFLRYLVYRDMRSKGRKIKAGMRKMPYLFFYEKPDRPSSHLVVSYSRNQRIPLGELQDLLSLGARFKKGIILALVDEEGEVSYYEIKKFATRAVDLAGSDRVDIAEVVGPMLVVWDHEGALSLYKEAYFGKPIGLRKPRAMNFSRPITLSYIEALYLAERGRVRLEDLDQSALKELKQRASEEENFRERYQVYRMLKESGLIVKSGMKFGVDFAVYEYGPGIDHAPFLIHVYKSDASITPTEIVRAGRLAASVKKKFVVAQVDQDRDLVLMLSFARIKP